MWSPQKHQGITPSFCLSVCLVVACFVRRALGSGSRSSYWDVPTARMCPHALTLAFTRDVHGVKGGFLLYDLVIPKSLLQCIRSRVASFYYLPLAWHHLPTSVRVEPFGPCNESFFLFLRCYRNLVSSPSPPRRFGTGMLQHEVGISILDFTLLRPQLQDPFLFKSRILQSRGCDICYQCAGWLGLNPSCPECCCFQGAMHLGCIQQSCIVVS